jgi:hypothetical protein
MDTHSLKIFDFVVSHLQVRGRLRLEFLNSLTREFGLHLLGWVYEDGSGWGLHRIVPANHHLRARVLLQVRRILCELSVFGGGGCRLVTNHNVHVALLRRGALGAPVPDGAVAWVLWEIFIDFFAITTGALAPPAEAAVVRFPLPLALCTPRNFFWRVVHFFITMRGTCEGTKSTLVLFFHHLNSVGSYYNVLFTFFCSNNARSFRLK